MISRSRSFPSGRGFGNRLPINLNQRRLTALKPIQPLNVRTLPEGCLWDICKSDVWT
ncbi:hypothetical protein FHT86_001003 [Rhizobium sp. BK313]|nr:hypothetical protein [Rhizobium sp. BK313]